MSAVMEHQDGNISAKLWEVQAFADGEPLTYYEVYFKFGSISPILRLHQSDLSNLESVLSRITEDIDRRYAVAEFSQAVSPA